MPGEKRPIAADDLYRIVCIEDPRISPDGRWVAYVHVAVDRAENGYKRTIWLAPTDGGQPVQLTRSGKDTQPRWSPDGTRLAFTSARSGKPQIYILPVTAPGGEPRPLTELAQGASNPAWSPDGSAIAFLGRTNAEERAKEDGGEEEIPPVDSFEAKQRSERQEHEEAQRFDPRPITRIPYREGTAYRDDRHAQIYVVATAEKAGKERPKPRRLTSIEADHSEPHWTPDGQYILTSRTWDPAGDEPWRSTAVYRIRVEDGSVEQMTAQDHSASSEVLPSPDGRWVAFLRVPVERLSERITRLAVIPAAGGPARDLNLELDRSPISYRWAPDSAALIFNAGNWGDVEVYRADLAGGRVEKIISGRMEVTEFDVGPDGSVAFAANTPLSPPELFWQPPGADEPLQMTEANSAFLAEVIVQETHEMHFTSPGGQKLQGWYILPVGYEKGKRYPLAFNIHGGPHVMWGPSTRSMWHEWQFHAARGYVVFYANPRGSDGYGEAFQEALHAAWGEIAFADLMAGIDALLEKGFVDPERMAVTGGSYGGYMTGWIVGHTDRFACAVSQRGVYNLVSFYGTSDIPTFIKDQFGVVPWEDAALLWEHSPLAYAQNIRTPLLLLHSENDFRVPIEQAEQLFAFVRLRGGMVKLVRFPRDGHELSRSGEPKHRVSRLTHMVEWFDRYCMPPGEQ